jgi:Holliday junction resolvase
LSKLNFNITQPYMESTDSVDRSLYEQIVHSVVTYLREKGFSSVKANSPAYALPGRIKWDDQDEGVVPDIVGEHGDCVYVFEIVNVNQLDPKAVENRWRLLSVHARRMRGVLYLVTPERSAETVQKLAASLDLRPKFLRLRGIA